MVWQRHDAGTLSQAASAAHNNAGAQILAPACKVRDDSAAAASHDPGGSHSQRSRSSTLVVGWSKPNPAAQLNQHFRGLPQPSCRQQRRATTALCFLVHHASSIAEGIAQGVCSTTEDRENHKAALLQIDSSTARMEQEQPKSEMIGEIGPTSTNSWPFLLGDERFYWLSSCLGTDKQQMPIEWCAHYVRGTSTSTSAQYHKLKTRRKMLKDIESITTRRTQLVRIV